MPPKKKLPTKQKPPKDHAEAMERDAEAEARRREIKAETAEKLARTYTVTLTASERFWVATTLARYGSARTPDEDRFLEKINAAQPDKPDMPLRSRRDHLDPTDA